MVALFPLKSTSGLWPVTEDNLPPASAHMKSTMTPIQVAALERFLTNSNFKYDDYDQELGVVLYIFTVGDWTIEVAYGQYLSVKEF